jgi:hypothetical protein
VSDWENITVDKNGVHDMTSSKQIQRQRPTDLATAIQQMAETASFQSDAYLGVTHHVSLGEQKLAEALLMAIRRLDKEDEYRREQAEYE